MARNSTSSASPLFPDSTKPEQWLEGNPIDASLTMSIRVALRSLPEARPPVGSIEFSGATLRIFRALAVAWASARYAHHRRRLQRFALQSENALEPILEAEEKKPFRLAHAAAHAAGHERDGAIAAAVFGLTNNGVNRDDATFISNGPRSRRRRANNAVELAARPLWPMGQPVRARAGWLGLKNALLETAQDWEVWIEWYEDRVAGRTSFGEDFDLAVATLPNELWDQGPALVNARIKELIAEHTQPE